MADDTMNRPSAGSVWAPADTAPASAGSRAAGRDVLDFVPDSWRLEFEEQERAGAASAARHRQRVIRASMTILAAAALTTVVLLIDWEALRAWFTAETPARGLLPRVPSPTEQLYELAMFCLYVALPAFGLCCSALGVIHYWGSWRRRS